MGIQKAFEQDWPKGLFILAAEKIDSGDSQTLRYWQNIANRYLMRLCHTPESEHAVSIAPAGEGELSTWVLTAPPMMGGEYLSVGILRSLWAGLDQWVCQQIQVSGGTKAFLNSFAPKWHQVGRVCFHLAENKANHSSPFAFMVTYSTGFGTGGTPSSSFDA